MGIIKAVTDSVGGTFADQWKEIITAGKFNEHTVVAPGIIKKTNNARGTNVRGSYGVISNGSRIFVPENTAAFIFSQAGIENIITEPGSYDFQEGEKSFFNGDGFGAAIFGQVKDRIGYGGISSSEHRIAFVNLREIRDIKFGTRGPQVYNDIFYGVDLEVYAYGSFSIKVVEPELFIKNFVPPNTSRYSFDDEKVRGQVLSEFLQSFMVALNQLSTTYRIAQVPAHANEISSQIANDAFNAGTWKTRFGFEVVKVAIENIEFSQQSRELIQQYATNKMNVRAYEEVSQRASDIAAQQKIAQGIQENGLGNAGGMVFGMNMAQEFGAKVETKVQSTMSFDEQVEALKKLKELVDMEILTQEEFDKKKKEIMEM
ncbi:MAG: SPFH domain-containing protein [Lachnospiraceae bacterium]|nr:SPFH domain-containing protein [Lachnospiraceae bacterium]